MDEPLAVFVVWEPILATDVAPPTSRTLGLMPDKRAWQIWDKDHLMSDAMREAMRAFPTAIPLERRRTGGKAEGLLWDAVAVFPAGARWEQTLPAPAYLDGIVIEVMKDFEETLRRLTAGPPG